MHGGTKLTSAAGGRSGAKTKAKKDRVLLTAASILTNPHAIFSPMPPRTCRDPWNCQPGMHGIGSRHAWSRRKR